VEGTCDQHTGICHGGCKANWDGDQCDSKSKNGDQCEIMLRDINGDQCDRRGQV
jgi:hypothetical protein